MFHDLFQVQIHLPINIGDAKLNLEDIQLIGQYSSKDDHIIINSNVNKIPKYFEYVGKYENCNVIMNIEDEKYNILKSLLKHQLNIESVEVSLEQINVTIKDKVYYKLNIPSDLLEINNYHSRSNIDKVIKTNITKVYKHTNIPRKREYNHNAIIRCKINLDECKIIIFIIPKKKLLTYQS